MTDSLSGTDLDPKTIHIILKSLSNPRYRARTAVGIAKETGLDEAVVQECLDNHILSVRHIEPGRGKTLYTFRCSHCKGVFG